MSPGMQPAYGIAVGRYRKSSHIYLSKESLRPEREKESPDIPNCPACPILNRRMLQTQTPPNSILNCMPAVAHYATLLPRQMNTTDLYPLTAPYLAGELGAQEP